MSSLNLQIQTILNVDFVVDYRHFLFHKQSQATQSFITPDGIFSPTRVSHGSTNADLHLQSTLGSVLPSALNLISFCWLDDILGHGRTMNEHLNQLCKFFSILI